MFLCRHGGNNWDFISVTDITAVLSWYLTMYSSLCNSFEDRALVDHDDVIKLRHFPRYWPFVRGIHRSPVNSPHKGQWRGASMFSLICVWINGWVNNREVGDLRRYRAYYDVIVVWNLRVPSFIWVTMTWFKSKGTWIVVQVMATRATCSIIFQHLCGAPNDRLITVIWKILRDINGANWPRWQTPRLFPGPFFAMFILHNHYWWPQSKTGPFTISMLT